MTASVVSWYQGTSHSIVTTVVNTSNQAVDVTGATVNFVMVNTLTSEIIAEKAVGDGVTLGGTNGRVTVDIGPTDTATASPGDYRAQAEVTLADNTTFMAYDVVVSIKKNYAR